MSRNTIHFKGDFQRAEYRANAGLTPGHLLEINSSNKVLKHATEGGRSQYLVAIEDALQGNIIDHAYEADELVACNIEKPGNEVYMFIKAGEDIAIGDELISAGDGTLIENGSEESITTVLQVIATALEAIDLTDSDDEATRIPVMMHP